MCTHTGFLTLTLQGWFYLWNSRAGKLGGNEQNIPLTLPAPGIDLGNLSHARQISPPLHHVQGGHHLYLRGRERWGTAGQHASQRQIWWQGEGYGLIMNGFNQICVRYQTKFSLPMSCPDYTVTASVHVYVGLSEYLKPTMAFKNCMTKLPSQ